MLCCTFRLAPKWGSNPLIAFAIIEVENFPSMGASKHFLETTRQLQVTAYSFMNPKFNSNVHLLEESDYNVMVENLRAMYRGHVMVSEIEKIYPHSAVQAYYVFKRNGRVTAGAQVNVFAFRLVECQCFWLFKMLSELPIFRVLPENLIFHSCGLNNIWHESGCEGDIPVLIESIMARHLRHVALFVYDTGSAPSLHIARTTSCRYRNGVIGTMCTSVFPPYCIKAGVLDSPWPIEHLKNTPWLFTYNGS
ncbi:hypothetical protein Pelo_10118 [Pelomyxa schiedti]|nr:hypothetical protein Pelo_10118 [Pelomyxa schiedti]